MAERPSEPQQAAFSYPGSPERSGRRDTPYFSTPELRQRLDLLRHLTDNSEKILLVKGPQWAGKSTLLQHYREEAREEWDLCCLQASSQLQPDRFYALLFRRFGITDTSEHGVDNLVRRFEMLAAAGHLPVLVIDDADQLPAATVIAIFRLFERRPGTRALIRVVLFATPDIVSLLRTPQLQAMNLQAVQSLELPRLNPDQSRAFVHFLLESAVPQGGVQIGAGRLARLLKESDGLPGALESGLRQQLANATPSSSPPESQVQALPAGTGRRRLSVLTDLPLPLVAGGIVLVVLLLLALVFQDQVNRLFEGTSTEATRSVEGGGVQGPVRELRLPRQASSLPETQEELLPDQAEPLPASPAAPVAPPLSLPEIAAEREVDPVADPDRVPAGGQSGQVAAADDEAGAVSNAAETEADAGQEVGIEAETGVESGVETGPEVEQESPRPVVSETAPESAPAEPPAEAEIQAGKEDVAATPAEVESASGGTIPQAESQLEQAQVETAARASPVKREDWLRLQPPGHYTLQLVGVGSEQAALGFIRRHRLDGDVAYFRTVRDGKPWFSVLYGVFPDRGAALRGRSRLPSSFRSRDAWPRTFASIHAVIKE